MVLIIQVVAVFLVAIAMSMALAHVLEFPGNLRLDRQTSEAVQTIYYPGFTVAGAAEPLAVVATLILLLLMHKRNGAVCCTSPYTKSWRSPSRSLGPSKREPTAPQTKLPRPTMIVAVTFVSEVASLSLTLLPKRRERGKCVFRNTEEDMFGPKCGRVAGKAVV